MRSETVREGCHLKPALTVLQLACEGKIKSLGWNTYVGSNG